MVAPRPLLQVLLVAPQPLFLFLQYGEAVGLELAWPPLRPPPPTALHPITLLPLIIAWPLLDPAAKRGIAFLLWDPYQSCQLKVPQKWFGNNQKLSCNGVNFWETEGQVNTIRRSQIKSGFPAVVKDKPSVKKTCIQQKALLLTAIQLFQLLLQAFALWRTGQYWN